ncbi:MAG: c-type cytochrome [Saprospiraceae bacterium]|nr:c-type cytochrome [Saprospiraceae bacterium]
MKRFLKITAWILGILVLIIGALVAWVAFAPAPTYDPPTIPDLKVEATPERIARGAELASMLCVICHTGQDKKLSGEHMLDVPLSFGKIHSFNITQHPEKGIGAWSDGEIYAFLRSGLRKDGTFAAMMPKFPHMAEEDVYSIIAWLRSDDPRLAPSEKDNAKNELTFLSKALLKFAFKPLPMPEKAIPLPDTTDQIAWGRYIATGVYGCFACHSEDFATVNDLEPEKSAGFFGGGNPMLDFDGNLIPSANITPDKETGIGNWTEEQFLTTLKTGQSPNGPIRYPMLPYAILDTAEIKAVWAYLKTVPPLKNEVARAPRD